jgi:hypothetical protein
MRTGDGKARQVFRISEEMIERIAGFLIVPLRPICYFSLNISRIQAVY